MPRPIWKGAISFGLVTVPVGLHAATARSEQIRFRYEKGQQSLETPRRARRPRKKAA